MEKTNSKSQRQALKNCINQGLEKLAEFDGKELIIEFDGFKPVTLFVENDIKIFVTDEPEFIEVLKILKISGIQRSTQKQRKRGGKL